MNREYRVYDTEQKRYITDKRLWFVSPDGTLYYLKTENAAFVKAHNCIIEWAVGLQDTNGTKIFEGDILRQAEYMNDNRFGIVTYSTTPGVGIGYQLFDKDGYEIHSDEWDDFEVVGNIHDNPELIEHGVFS